jgi:hypothetical protein
MALIPAVITVDARKYWSRMLSGLIPLHVIDTFRVGEGGWIDPGTGRVRRAPVPDLRRLDSGLQDLDAAVDVTRGASSQRYPAAQRGVYEKALDPGDLDAEDPSTVRVSCLLDFGEFNDNGHGTSPELWEIGLFCTHPDNSSAKLMVAYATFPREVKTPDRQILNYVRVIF